ncbi:patatin-like phospholipase family protein [Paraburkholderia diazotrophica]|uniref:NTE family protein n=1 Tax=Paraburkholderia diazotrophica TaxID=667676 RepID=A0A1H7DX14_9BURK|nr:patatin-like phospholipase family protein [Paraburkholderia diazotrophica]SEK05367.1 NTE family protein [Paraburkholderia diazotrophica]
MDAHDRKRIAVAVQGGGAHGAFSWGALDRLLEEVERDRLEIVALSGTSAGGFNATLCAYALGTDDEQVLRAQTARKLLKEYWLSDAAEAPFSPYTVTARAWHETTGSWNIDSSLVALTAALGNQFWSPLFFPQYDWLAQVLGNRIDFPTLQLQREPPHLYIATTNITLGRRDIFAKSAVTLEVLKASASIPQIFMPAHYGDYDYWDGGFMGNPPLSPLISHATDVVIIQLNPFARNERPLTAMAISNRVNEVTFNSSLIHEINAIEAMNKVLDYLDDKSKDNASVRQALETLGPLPFNRVNLYRITDEPYMRTLGYASKAVIVREFLQELYEKGWKAADDWVNKYYSSLSSTAPRVTALSDAPPAKDFPDQVLDDLLSRKNTFR